jgi:hypothetical protein
MRPSAFGTALAAGVSLLADALTVARVAEWVGVAPAARADGHHEAIRSHDASVMEEIYRPFDQDRTIGHDPQDTMLPVPM